MDGLYWKTLLKWMIWGYPYFWQDLKPPIAIVNQELPIPSLGTQEPPSF